MKYARILAALLLIMAAALFAATFFVATPDELLLTYHQHITAFVTARQTLALSVFALSYVIVTAFGTPGSAILTLAGGMLFGSIVGGFTSILAATAGGTILFAAVRAGFAETLAARMPPRVGRLVDGFRRDGFFFLLFLRITPLLPFFAVNLIAAAGGLRLVSFVAATLIGIAPMNFVLATIGAGLQDVINQQATDYLTCKAAQTNPCVGLEISDFLNGRILWPLSLLGLIAILPVLAKRWRRRALADVPHG